MTYEVKVRGSAEDESSSLEGTRKIPAGRKSIRKGTIVGSSGMDSGTRKPSSVAGMELCPVGEKVVEPEHKQHCSPAWGVCMLPASQQKLLKTPIQAIGSELDLLKKCGVRSLIGDGLQGKKPETEARGCM